MNDSQLIAIARQKADIRSLREHVDYWIGRMSQAQEDNCEWAERQAKQELQRFIDRDEP